MTEARWMQGTPRTILIATDLSARCDRALDRAAGLAAGWGAKLLVVHALDPVAAEDVRYTPSWRRAPDPLETARARIAADLADHGAGVEIDVRVETGDPAKLVAEIARKEDADLIVTGVARDASLGRILTGSAVDRLVRRAPAPLLVVRGRGQTPYRAVTVATDFSRSSRHAFEAAARLFPHLPITLFHAYDIPFAGYLENQAVVGEFAQMGEEACGKFIAEADLPEGRAGEVRRVIERGAPDSLLVDYARKHDVGLTVVGSHGGGAIYNALIGSTAARIIDAMPGDVLLIRDPQAK